MFFLKVAGFRGHQHTNTGFIIYTPLVYSLVLKSRFGGQASNRAGKWSERQRSKENAFQGPRFTGVDLASQPNPLAAIELLKQQSIVVTTARVVTCDGDGLLGHPKVFINLVEKL